MSSGVLLHCETKGDQSTSSMLFYFCPVAIYTCVELDFGHVYFCFGALGACKMVTNEILDCRMKLQSGKIYVGPVSRFKEGKE